MNDIIESENFILTKSEEDYIIQDINFLLKNYETTIKTDVNTNIILNGSLICEYILNLVLKKKKILIKHESNLKQIITFCRDEKIIPIECLNFLEIIISFRNIASQNPDTPNELISSFLNAFIYYITWFNEYYSDNFNVKDPFEIKEFIKSDKNTKLFSVDEIVINNQYSEPIDNFTNKENSPDERISNKIKDMFKKTNEINVKGSPETINKTYMDNFNQEMILKMLEQQTNDIKLILKTVSETLEITKGIDEKLNIISNNLNRIQSQSEKLIKLAWSEEEIDRIIEVHTTQCVENILEYKNDILKNDQYSQEKVKLIDNFGEDAWNKLSIESQTFLITAKFMYNKFITLDEVVDYSGICVLITKALEVEIFKRFFTNFIAYLDEKYHKDYSKYHTALLFQYKEPLREERFTMGNIAFVLCKKENRYDNKEQKENNKKELLEYCRECVFSNYSTSQIERMLDSYSSSIELIRVKYRNPSAHRNYIRRITAKDCFDLVVDVQKLLKEMLDSFDN